MALAVLPEVPPSGLHDCLVRVRTLLENPARWTRREIARDALGKPTASEFSEDAARWCLTGAARVVCRDSAPAILSAIAGFINLPYNCPAGLDCPECTSDNVVTFNDNSSTSHADILRVVDEAIASQTLISARSHDA